MPRKEKVPRKPRSREEMQKFQQEVDTNREKIRNQKDALLTEELKTIRTGEMTAEMRGHYDQAKRHLHEESEKVDDMQRRLYRYEEEMRAMGI